MKTLRYQTGMSSLGWLLVLMAAGFFLMCAFKLIPSYSENTYIVQGLKSLNEGDTSVTQMSNSEIRNTLSKFFMVNNVRSEGSKNIKVTRSSKKTLVDINYETRIPLIYNIDVVLTFENQLDSSRPEACCKPQSE